jgi:hypothetical protein
MAWQKATDTSAAFSLLHPIVEEQNLENVFMSSLSQGRKY